MHMYLSIYHNIRISTIFRHTISTLVKSEAFIFRNFPRKNLKHHYTYYIIKQTKQVERAGGSPVKILGFCYFNLSVKKRIRS